MVIIALTLAPYASAEQCDLVINNGRVLDPETKYDAVANVYITEGRIAVITQDKISDKKTIDATGHVVAPGFIDTYYHATDPFGQKLGVADGITTAMDIEHGALAIGYRFKRFDLNAGYRYMRYDFDSDEAVDDLTLHGPFAGIKFEF